MYWNRQSHILIIVLLTLLQPFGAQIVSPAELNQTDIKHLSSQDFLKSMPAWDKVELPYFSELLPKSDHALYLGELQEKRCEAARHRIEVAARAQFPVIEPALDNRDGSRNWSVVVLHSTYPEIPYCVTVRRFLTAAGQINELGINSPPSDGTARSSAALDTEPYRYARDGAVQSLFGMALGDFVPAIRDVVDLHLTSHQVSIDPDILLLTLFHLDRLDLLDSEAEALMRDLLPNATPYALQQRQRLAGFKEMQPSFKAWRNLVANGAVFSRWGRDQARITTAQ